MPTVPVRFGISHHVERTRTIHPVGNGESYIRYCILVWVDVGESHYQTHEYVAWCFGDDLGKYGPLRTFDVPFTGLGIRYPRCPDGEVTDPSSSKKIKLKEKYFKRNGGLLLETKLSSPDGNVEKSKLFNSKDLEKAHDNFNDVRKLRQGGQGTVYKGMLTDGKIVAIKKSKVIDEGKVELFINEILIRSQINHRNMVKLLGCCLETEVPLLVYEFIPNGTLYQYLHHPNEEFRVSWDTQLQIATEIVGALFYLHSAASIPIYHRDIKSTNILLDENYRAKVTDFDTSKSVSLDQTYMQGTFGCLDPKYFQSSQFTDKSDVYSFGVVLVELLTGKKPISLLREQEGRSLATYFIISMEQNRLFDIVIAQVLKEGKKEDIASVANLAKRWLYLNGRNRPTMKEVAMELERIRKLQNPSGIQQNLEDREATESYDVAFPSSKSNVDMDAIKLSDVQP